MKIPQLNILPIMRKEFLQIGRDKRVLGVLILVPAMMLVLFGYAVNFDVRHTSMAVFDEDMTRESRELVTQFTNNEYFDLVRTVDRPQQIDRLLDAKVARVVIVIPKNFSNHLTSGSEAKIQVLVDGENASAAATALGYIRAIVQEYSLGIVQETLMRRGGSMIELPLEFRPRIWYNPELRSARFLVPGLIAFILMITTVISTSLSVVRERELGTMEQMTVSPVKPVQLILGKTIPYTIISLVATVVILIVAYFFFDVVVEGSFLNLFIVTFLFLVGGLGMGLMVSTVADNQQVAFMAAVILTMLPSFILSGFVFPIRNMPVAIQVVTYLVPARYFLVALRGIILKGAGLGAFWEQIVLLTVFAVVMLAASVRRMHKLLG